MLEKKENYMLLLCKDNYLCDKILFKSKEILKYARKMTSSYSLQLCYKNSPWRGQTVHPSAISPASRAPSPGEGRHTSSRHPSVQPCCRRTRKWRPRRWCRHLRSVSWETFSRTACWAPGSAPSDLERWPWSRLARAGERSSEERCGTWETAVCKFCGSPAAGTRKEGVGKAAVKKKKNK